jgi:hypothetical protein
MNGSSIVAIGLLKEPRVQCHPNVAAAAAVTAKMPKSTRCRREGAHKARAPKAATWKAATALKTAAVIDD